MKIFRNIPGFLMLASDVFWADRYAKEIDRLSEQGNIKEEKALISSTLSGWANRILEKWDWTINANGLENLPKDGPVVFISNHQGFADVLPFMYLVPFQTGFIAKSEIKKVPHFAAWVTRIRGLYIERGDVRSSLRTISEGAEYLKQGFSMVIFPEGTRSKGEGHPLGEFHAGSFKLATKAKVPIIPVTINGSYRCFEETGVMLKHQSFDVTFHEPIDVSAMDRYQQAELPEKVREIIQSAL